MELGGGGGAGVNKWHYRLERVLAQSHGDEDPLEWPHNLQKRRRDE